MPEEKTEKTEKTDVDVMFPEKEIYGVKVRPWTFNQFVTILPIMAQGRKDLKENGIGIEDLEKLKDGDTDGIMDFLVKLFPILPVMDIVSKTVNMDRKKVEMWEFDKTVAIFLMILIQNAGRIKNSFGLGLTAVRAMKDAG